MSSNVWRHLNVSMRLNVTIQFVFQMIKVSYIQVLILNFVNFLIFFYLIIFDLFFFKFCSNFVSKNLECDGYMDCLDFSDELFCSNGKCEYKELKSKNCSFKN